MDTVSIRSKSGAELEGMRDACRLAATALAFAGAQVEEGRATDDIDKAVHDFIVTKLKCYPSPLGYSGFPKSICTSINEVLCHGIPDDRTLRAGDQLNIDVSVYTDKGYHGDCSDMFHVGAIDSAGARLTQVTRDALDAAIRSCQPGQSYSVIGDVIDKVVSESATEFYARHPEMSAGDDHMLPFQVVSEFTGHGIGTHFHMLPYIIHVPNRYPGSMKVGHTFTIEPVVVEGSPKFRILPDKWTAVSTDGGRGAQVEHTVLITESGCQMLTIPDKSLLPN